MWNLIATVISVGIRMIVICGGQYDRPCISVNKQKVPTHVRESQTRAGRYCAAVRAGGGAKYIQVLCVPHVGGRMVGGMVRAPPQPQSGRAWADASLFLGWLFLAFPSLD